MNFPLTILIIILQVHVSISEFNINDHIKNYEFAEYVIRTENGENEFSEHEVRNLKFHRKSTEIHIKTAKREFTLLLYEDDLFRTIPIEAYQFGEFTKNYCNVTTIYEGFVKNRSLFSYVIGYLYDGVFSGNIFDGEDMFIIEPIQTFARNTSGSQKAIFYNIQNLITIEGNHSENVTSFSRQPLKVSYRTANFTLHSAPRVLGLVYKLRDMFCELEIVADHKLYEFFQKDTERLSAYLYYHAKYADKIFRKTDFDFDGKPDGIRITVKKISIYKTPFESNYPMLNASGITDYLLRLVKRKQEEQFCLSFAFTYQNFSGYVIGEAFKPDLGLIGVIGGICDDPKVTPNNTLLHFNTGVINLYVNRDEMLPLAVSLLAFTHELGHNFGSDHDPPHFNACSFEGHIMSERVMPGSKNFEFSPCSRAEMSAIIKVKGICLKERDSICGNLIREGEEECDCGWSSICEFMDPCCNPMDVKLPEIGCTIKSGASFECSRKESDCCLENCTIVKDTKMPCYVDNFLCLKSFCDGINPVCLPPVIDESSYSCGIKQSTHTGNNDNISICESHGYSDCTCSRDIKEICVMCCENQESCLPASVLGLFDSSGNEYYHKIGTSCYNESFYCDGLGNCVRKDLQKERDIALYVALSVILVIFFILLGIVIYLKYRKEHFLMSNHSSQ
ncbi:disintegrin and metalloproteinase domain-containing protein 10-like [Parasteatoda tepidariorum]|uniref:disintegrin and metalloproteinase domain-containing protein 10-like n=1 Tax=Parasteatoda tepidariorum TaxID=114398 RepID=UPI001C728251|nr:disintegrin and metalloproteinase domain-containing protein 10-like [Parasteatoda tepidariorum]